MDTLKGIDIAASSAKRLRILCYVSDNEPTSNLDSIIDNHNFLAIKILYTKNALNIGAGANIVKVCSNIPVDYIWPIGDDSNVDYTKLLHSVEQVLISESPNILFISSTFKALIIDKKSSKTLQFYQKLSSLEFFDQPLSSEEGFLGRWIYKNSSYFNELLVQSITIQNYAHPYLYLSYKVIGTNHSLIIIKSPYITSGKDPDLTKCNYRVLPRWSVAAAHYGAWKSALHVMTGQTGQNQHLNYLIRKRESNYRLPIILNALLRDALGFAPCNLNSSSILWILKNSHLQSKPTALIVTVLYYIRNISILSCLILALLWLGSFRFRNSVRLYLTSIELPECTFNTAVNLVFMRHDRFRSLADSDHRATVIY